ncbi:MAG: hypothetical protein ABIV51_14445 [Saprospiraceae bacterium]
MQKNRTIRPLYKALLILVVMCCAACQDEVEPIPAFVTVAPFTLTTDAAEEGYPSINLPDAWAYADSIFLGGFGINRPFPVLEEGITQLEIFPGFRDNGIKAAPDIYPFYTTVKVNVDLKPGEIDTIYPQIKYRSGLAFPLRDNFDFSTVMESDLDSDPETKLELNQSEAIYGPSCGKITLSKDHSKVQVACNFILSDLPTTGQAVYLELDYKTDVRFAVGVLGYIPSSGAQSIDVVYVNPKDNWNKIYVNLSEVLHLSQLDDYKIYLAAIYTGDAAVDEKQNIYVDNLKVVYFN